MENMYVKYGLKKVINASGRMTKLGVSTVSERVALAMNDAARHYVEMDELMALAGHLISELTEAADACVTSSASAGIALSVASLISGDDLHRVMELPSICERAPKREVILLKGHNVDYGAPISTMVQLGGGKVVEVGYANRASLDDIKDALNEKTLAILYIKSHHCVQKNMPTYEGVIKLANSMGIPVIVDAAAEENLDRYITCGADFVCYSGAKSIEGPTSGFVLCKNKQNAKNMRLQYRGIGRAMKIGKECIMGLLVALEDYVNNNKSQCVGLRELEVFKERINLIEGCFAIIEHDESGRDINRCKITFDKETFGLNAEEVVEKLIDGEVSIYTRDYLKNLGSISIDPRPLNDHKELEIIANRIEKIYRER